jgi:hypothetical protein
MFAIRVGSGNCSDRYVVTITRQSTESPSGTVEHSFFVAPQDAKEVSKILCTFRDMDERDFARICNWLDVIGD